MTAHGGPSTAVGAVGPSPDNKFDYIGTDTKRIVRKLMLIQGQSRVSVFFSILDSEWPTVKSDLESKLDRCICG